MPTEVVFAVRMVASAGFAIIAVMLWLVHDRLTAVLATTAGALYFYFSFQVPGVEGWPSLFLVLLLARFIYVMAKGDQWNSGQ